MSSSEFISEARQFLSQQEASLTNYLSILENVKSNRFKSLLQIKNKILSSVETILSAYATFNSIRDAIDNLAEDFSDGVTSGDTASESVMVQNRKVLATLGALFATDPNAPAYLAKKSADEFVSVLEDRYTYLSQAKADATNLYYQINSITDDWYADYLADTTNAKNDVDNAISNMLTVRSFINEQSAINDGEIGLARDNILSAIDYLARTDSSASLLDIMHYIEDLNSLASYLETLDEEASTYKTNLENFIDNFNTYAVGNNRFLGYVREATAHQYSELQSISRSMSATLDKNSAILAMTQSREWIEKLSTIAASIENTVVDYGSYLNDSSNENTVQLTTYIDNLGELDRSIEDTVPSEIRLLTSEANKVTINNISKDHFNSLYTTLIADIDSQMTYTQNLITDSTTYDPTVVESVDEFIQLTNNLDLDRAKSVLISSNWEEIFKLDELKLSFNDRLARLIAGFIDNVEDAELAVRIKSLYYQIQSKQRIKKILALTFDKLRVDAISNIRNERLQNIYSLTAQLETISRKLSVN